MGLGPPVCSKCMIFAKVFDENDPRRPPLKVKYGYSWYHCPQCEAVEFPRNFFEFSSEEQKEIEFNSARWRLKDIMRRK